MIKAKVKCPLLVILFGALLPMPTTSLEAKKVYPPIQKSKPNIVWIITEDMSPELGCYGYPLVQTPNLDRLASQGVRYTNTFVTGPVCSASRSALITGMYQTS
ncbi:MAG: sulfatase-like hydrolase/transferase, partial [Segetibacter sp.]|nr:sulfatase-like hydrolase/transferase [Segetibacter sp.]